MFRSGGAAIISKLQQSFPKDLISTFQQFVTANLIYSSRFSHSIVSLLLRSILTHFQSATFRGSISSFQLQRRINLSLAFPSRLVILLTTLSIVFVELLNAT